MSYILPADPTAIETAVAVNADAITANSTTLNNHGTRLNATETATTNNANSIATNAANISSNNSDISALQSTVSGHTSSIGTNSSNINNNATNISNNATNISSNGSLISTNTSSISAINASKGSANGLCPLDGSSQVPLANLKGGVANGLATLDGSGDVPVSQLGNAAVLPTGVSWSANNITILNDASAGVALRVEGSENPVIEVRDEDLTTTYSHATAGGFLINSTNGYSSMQGTPGTDFTFSFVQSGGDNVTIGMSNDQFTIYTDNTRSETVQLGHNNPTYTWENVYGQNAYTATSDRKAKRAIKGEAKGIKFLSKLKPRTWKRRKSGAVRVHHGLIAQDVEELLANDPSIQDPDGNDAFVVKTEEWITKKDGTKELRKNEDGSIYYHYGLRYGEFIGPIITAIQELVAENEGIKARLAALEKKKK